MVNRNIEKRVKLRKGRFDEIERIERNIDNELFKGYFTDYKSTSNMYKKLSKKKDTVNQVWVDSMKDIKWITKNHWLYTERLCS